MIGCNTLGVLLTLKNPNPFPTNNSSMKIPVRITPNSKLLNFLKLGGKYLYKKNIATNIISNLNVVVKKNSSMNTVARNIPKIAIGYFKSDLIIFFSFFLLSFYILNIPIFRQLSVMTAKSIKKLGKLYFAKLMGLE